MSKTDRGTRETEEQERQWNERGKGMREIHKE